MISALASASAHVRSMPRCERQRNRAPDIAGDAMPGTGCATNGWIAAHEVARPIASAATTTNRRISCHPLLQLCERSHFGLPHPPGPDAAFPRQRPGRRRFVPEPTLGQHMALELVQCLGCSCQELYPLSSSCFEPAVPSRPQETEQLSPYRFRHVRRHCHAWQRRQFQPEYRRDRCRRLWLDCPPDPRPGLSHRGRPVLRSVDQKPGPCRRLDLLRGNVAADHPRALSLPGASGNPLDRHHAAHGRAMHESPLRQVVILDGPVLHRAIVPHQQVPGAQLVAIDEGGLDDMIRECGDQRLRFRCFQPLDASTIVAHDVQAFAPGVGMHPDDRMPDRRKAIDFRWCGWKGPLAATEIEYSASPVDPLLDWLGQGIPRRRGAGEFGVPEGKAEQGGDFESVEHGPAWRSSSVAHVAMPILAGATHADRATVLCCVGNHYNLRAAGHAPTLAKDVEFDITKAAGEGDLLWWCNSLVAEEYDRVSIKGLLDRGEGRLVKGVGQIDATDLGADHGIGR